MAGRVAVERTHICDVVGCKDAWQILRNRSCLSRGTAVNLCGVLQTRSEMIDIKGTKLFLIKLECGINIIVKKSTCLRWHDEIQIGHEHVYTKLIPTSLQKGGNHQHELYAVDEGSKMYIRHDVDFAIISAEEWLQKHSKPSFRNTEFKNIPAPIENLDLFSYKGTVTQVLDVSFRIYELDNAVRLFMSQCPPAAPRPRVGDELLIHNAHHQLNTKHAKLLLHCCALSSIQISSKRERLEDSTDVPSITLQKTLYASLLSQSQVENLCEIKLMLNQQFPQPRLSDRMFLHLMKTEPSIGSMFISNSRNVLDEFLTCLHHCPLTRRETLVCLLFEGPLLRHYGVIYPGMFLNFVAAKSAPLFAMNISNVNIQKMAVKSKTRILLSVNSAADVCETWQGTWSPWDTLSSLTAVLQQGFQIGIVSFEGLVVRRMTTSPDRESSHKDTWSSAGVPQQCARLLVEDILHENKKIWLYVNERDARCPAGLIPGSRAAFYNVERKVAKNGNVYCRYVQFSSVRILCFQSDRLAFSSRDNVKNDIPAQASALPLVFLSDIWTQSCTSQVYRCACDVIRVPKVSLKCTCGTCTSLIVGGQCTSPGCITGETWDYSARASIVVDDGSCVAMVTLTGPDVQSLLQLTDEQWNALRQEVSMVGEVFVQGVCPVLETPVHQFVHMLSESRSVKRTWDLLLAQSVTRIDINTIEPEDFVWKEFDTGSGRVNTQCLPFLQLKCLKLSTFCPESIIQHQM
ncbi:CST complex subunit CTC1-like [Dreissena polymorpha]|uniref:CST complex subunit CTC1-like n=1 Tax=Dreissena polymorpha TaxID=45954 RepID=UPI002264B72E|nr:CST complex subunit CTC1-like [Dreissena polymorpha]